MSVGLPSHLARAANSRALATGARWAALVCLGAALVNVGVSSFAQGSAYSWMALLSLLPMAGLLVLLARRRTVVLTVVYLLVGGLCTFFYALALFEDNSSYRDTNLFVLALPIVAMTLVGGTSTGAVAGILWASAGFALAEVAMFFAASAAGRTFRTDAISLGAYLLLVGILTFNGLARGSRSRSQSAIHRAVRHSRLIALRRDLIADVTALLHDSVLSELLAIANADAGVLSPKLRDRLEADLRELGRDPTPAFPTAAFATPALGTPALATSGDGWFDSELHAAIELARDEGLAVDLSGDRNALALLSLERRRAV
ncbi:MAG TPA: ATP-binding protein, partial [Leifsonia sp.]|nr:ATP-binding protein [Leifsonia sp.]